MNIKRLVWPIILVTMGALSLAACAPSAPEAPAVQAEEAEHEDDGGHSHSPDDHMAGAHDVPAEAAAVPNPIEANHESLEAGEQLFATNCAVCHGESGQGDGPGAAGLEKPPANLNAGHSMTAKAETTPVMNTLKRVNSTPKPKTMPMMLRLKLTNTTKKQNTMKMRKSTTKTRKNITKRMGVKQRI
jgi:mono/diheme cytochrome c family protein